MEEEWCSLDLSGVTCNHHFFLLFSLTVHCVNLLTVPIAYVHLSHSLVAPLSIYLLCWQVEILTDMLCRAVGVVQNFHFIHELVTTLGLGRVVRS